MIKISKLSKRLIAPSHWEDGFTADGTGAVVVDPFADALGVIDVVAGLELIKLLFLFFKVVEANGAVFALKFAAIGNRDNLDM